MQADEELDTPRSTVTSFATLDLTAATTTPPPMSTPLHIDDIRRSIMDLVTSDKLDKDAALQVTRLFHALEMLMRHECTTRDTHIARLKADAERQRVQHELDRLTTSSAATPSPLPEPALVGRATKRFSR